MSQFQSPANWNVTSTSTIFQISSNDSSAFMTTFEITTVRNSITALFVVLNFLLALTGGAYVKSKARRQVARGQPVAVAELTSWLGLSDMAKYTWSLHLLPGGWLGLLMIFSGAVGVLHQFLTNTLVTPTLVPTRCIFDYGCVPPGGTSFSPASSDENVYRSQLASLTNGGKRGIYKRFFADNEIQMFRPDSSDIFGAWNCANIKNDTVPWSGHASFSNPPSGIPAQDWQLYLNSSAYLFRSGPYAMTEGTVSNTEVDFVQGFMIWSAASTTEMSFVRASILNLHLFLGGTPQALDFDCTLTLDQPVPPMEVGQVLEEWMSEAWGYQGAVSTAIDTALWLELILDAITTESIWNGNINPTNIVPAGTIGCVVEGTRVSVAILLILALIAAIFLCLLVAESCVLLASLRLPVKQRAGQLPFDLADWQLAAFHQGQRQAALAHRELRTVEFRYDNSMDKLCMGSHSMGPGHPTDFELRKSGFVEYGPNVSSYGTPFQIPRKPVMQSYVSVPSTADL